MLLFSRGFVSLKAETNASEFKSDPSNMLNMPEFPKNEMTDDIGELNESYVRKRALHVKYQSYIK